MLASIATCQTRVCLVPPAIQLTGSSIPPLAELTPHQHSLDAGIAIPSRAIPLQESEAGAGSLRFESRERAMQF